MSTLDWPTGRAWMPTRLTFGASTPRSAWASFFTGQQQSISHFGDRLRIDMTLPPCTYEDAAYREAFLMQLASAGDWVRLWHMQRPVPAGDLRGSPVLAASAATGARTIQLQGAGTDINLLSEAQAFGAPTWLAVNGGTVTSNVAARPNSATVSADQVTDDSVTQVEGIEQVLTVPDDTQTYTASIWIRATTGGTSKTPSLEVVISGGTQVQGILRVNLDTGTILLGTGTVTSTDGGTWWRISTTVTNNGSGNTNMAFRVFPARCDHNSSVTDVTQTGSAVIWGAQLERGAVLNGLSQPGLSAGDLLGIGSQLCVVGFAGAVQTTSQTLPVPLALPLRSAVTAGDPVTWFRPAGNFQLVGESVQAIEYLPGRYQSAVNLQFVEVY